ncbi:MAG: hypothetical protein Q9172_005296 [Xanthocarpia lactea]
MAPASSPRITRSTRAKRSSGPGKPSQNSTKKSKRSDAALRPYQNDADPRDHLELSDSGTSKRKRRNARLDYPVANKRSNEVGTGEVLSKARSASGRPGYHNSGSPMSTATKIREPLSFSPEPESSTNLSKMQFQDEEYGFTAKNRSLFRLRSVATLSHDLVEFPDMRCDQSKIEKMLGTTKPQTPVEFTQCYYDLRSAAFKWAKDYFHYDSSVPLDLMELATTQPELMDYINSTTASPQLMDWETFLEKKRAEIVYGILGKVLDVHVFGEEMFGATPTQKRLLRSSDRLTMDEDGFSRQISRAAEINALLLHPWILPTDFLRSIQKLQGQIISLLTPLLPHNQPPNSNFSAPLFALLLSAASLALAVRRSPNYIYYFVSTAPPGSDYNDEEMMALNAADMEMAASLPDVEPLIGSGQIKRVAAVTGWPACVAYCPVSDEEANDGDKKLTGAKMKTKKGIRTQMIACADVYVVLEAVDPSLHGAGRGRRTLRGDLLSRMKDVEEESEKKKGRMRGRLDVIGAVAAVAVLGGYVVDRAARREGLGE